MRIHNDTSASRCNPGAFTLIELLTVIAVIGILAGLVMPGIARTQESARRTACRNNLKQIIMAALMYADDDSGSALTGTYSDSDDDLNGLYPYVRNLKSFSCPSGRQLIRGNEYMEHPLTQKIILRDLYDIAEKRGGFGSGYEPFGFMNFTGSETTEFEFDGLRFRTPGIKKTLKTIDNRVRQSGALGLKGTVTSPSEIWLVVDQDSGGGDQGIQNFPDSNDNHGAAGSNVSRCDGSVVWVPVRRYLYEYEISQDEGQVQ